METRRTLLFVSLLAAAAMVASGGAFATADRTENYAVVSEWVILYHGEFDFSGAEASAERTLADLNVDGAVDTAEAFAYAASLAAAREGNASTWFAWDGEPAVWQNVTVALSGYEGSAVSGAPLTRVVDAILRVSPAPSANHTMTLAFDVSPTTWTLAVSLPDNWTIGNVSSLEVTAQTSTTLAANLTAGIGRVTLLAPAAPPLPITNTSNSTSTAPPTPPADNNTSSLLPRELTPPQGTAWPSLVAAGPYAWLWSFGGVLLLGSGLAALTARRRRTAAIARRGPSGPAYAIEGLFVIYRDGRLLYHRAGDSRNAFSDPELVGSMFTAVSNFIADTFSPTEGLTRLSYGENTVVVSEGHHLYGAAVIFGEPDEDLREELKETVRRVEVAFAGVIEEWDGSTEGFASISGLADPLFALSGGVTREAVRAAAQHRGVRVLSETEYYNGYVKLRVAVANDSDEAVRDAAFEVRFNEAVLRLARVDPPTFPVRGTRVFLGRLEPRERVAVAYFLDPQTCTQTSIEGECTYLDGAGHVRTALMRTRRAEVICPIFFTREHANPATLKRLLETSVKVRDSKAFSVERLPQGVTYADLYKLAVEVVQRHDVELIRDFTGVSPFFGRAWFYGRTKAKKHTVIIRAGAYEDRHAVEFFVAADSGAAITGLLAELNRAFLALLQRRLPGVKVGLVFDEAAKQALARIGMSFNGHPAPA